MKKLTDGSIEQQKPDGPEIIRAMKSATIDENGFVNWTQRCFCRTPLKHERKTVYDFFFETMKVTVILKHEIIEGVSFMDKLSSITQKSNQQCE
ncbi:MAG: hypothetical protein AAF554_14445 [Bacteroidota bacterium]